jgi:hypothetical protein
MRTLRTLVFIMLFIGPVKSWAQPGKCPKLPENYEWKNAREYKRDEDLVLKTLQWLNTTSMSNEVSVRGRANLFVLEWICGTPRMKLEINSEVLPFYANYPDLLFAYIFGMAQCKLAKNEPCNELKAIVSGYNAVAFQIGSTEGLKKAKELKPIYKAYKRDKMESYVESLITKTEEK